MDLLLYIFLDLLLVFGIGLLIFTLPGIWFMVSVIALGLWVFPEQTPYDWNLVFICIGLAVFSEVFEFISGFLGVKKMGGSKKGAWGAVFGGLVGAIGGSFFLPPLGTFAGLFIGTFLGVWFIERDINPDGSGKIALGATVARAFGLMVKFLVAGAIFVLVVIKQLESMAL